MTHLTEAERQCLADGTVAPDVAEALAPHLAVCAECAADVERLQATIRRMREEPVPNVELEAMWPAIRERIERGKVRALPASASAARRPWRGVWIGAGTAAAVICLALLLRVRPHEPPGSAPPAGSFVPNGATPTPAADSTGTSQAEIQRLLDEIELEKAMLPPATAAVADSDLRAIDQAIAELKEAIARDPNNPALRQMLAASYKQQQDLLRRLHNAS